MSFWTHTEDPRYNDSICHQRFCCKIEYAVIKKLVRTHLKHQSLIRVSTFFFINHFVYLLELPRQFRQIHKMYVFLMNKMGISMKKYTIFVQTKVTL